MSAGHSEAGGGGTGVSGAEGWQCAPGGVWGRGSGCKVVEGAVC